MLEWYGETFDPAVFKWARQSMVERYCCLSFKVVWFGFLPK